MTDHNQFHPILLFTMIFPTVSDVSIYNSPPALQSTVAVMRILPSVGVKLPPVMEVSLQPSTIRPNHLAHNSLPSLLTFL